MKRYFRFKTTHKSEQPEWLEDSTEHFALTEEKNTWWYVPFANPIEARQILKSHGVDTFEEVNIKDYVDWGVQWAEHAPGFKDYSLQITLSKYAEVSNDLPILHLKAGPGFGDLSHPTTRLTLSMMARHVFKKEVIDIGCGSGILSLAAILFGAKTAYGVDIDREAVTHAKENVLLNRMECFVTIEHTERFTPPATSDLTILMNMIRTQQQEAWSWWHPLHHLKACIITSGILVSEKDTYYEEAKSRGWKLVKEKQEGDWMAFLWKQ